MDKFTNHKLLSAIGQNSDWQHHHLFESGMSYLESYLSEQAALIPAYSHNQLFWAWWQQQYHRRNRMFYALIQRESLSLSRAQLLAEYQYRHMVDPRCIRPCQAVELSIYQDHKQTKQTA